MSGAGPRRRAGSAVDRCRRSVGVGRWLAAGSGLRGSRLGVVVAVGGGGAELSREGLGYVLVGLG